MLLKIRSNRHEGTLGKVYCWCCLQYSCHNIALSGKALQHKAFDFVNAFTKSKVRTVVMSCSALALALLQYTNCT